MDQNTDSSADGANENAGPDELTLLKARAKTLNISHSPNIGLDALRKKVNAAMLGGDDEGDDEAKGEEAAAPALSPVARKAALRRKIQKQELKLVRLRITNMNPSKKDLAGEIFTVANKYLGIVKRFVPYGEATDEGWHVPHCIYRQLKSRKFNQVKTKKNRTKPGQIDVTSRWVNEFALEVLDPLTPDEMRKLAVQQAASAGMS